MDIVKVRIHSKDEDAWVELGQIALGLARIMLAFVFLAPLLALLVKIASVLVDAHLHPVFCIMGIVVAALAIWYAFHTLRWLIIAYGAIYTAVVAALTFLEIRATADPVWALAGATVCAGMGLLLSWNVYRRGAIARGWAF